MPRTCAIWSARFLPNGAVDVFSLSDFAWGQVRPFRRLLAKVRPEALPVIEDLLIEKLLVISIRTARPRGILLQTIDDRLRNGRFICRHVGGKVGIRHVLHQEIYQVDRGGHGWRVNFSAGLVTPGNFPLLRGEGTRREDNCDRQCYG
jgi:hypothetical protein